MSNDPGTSPPTASPKPTIGLSKECEKPSRQPSLPIKIETIVDASHRAGALLTLFVPEHPAAVITSKHTAELPLMNWLIVGFPADRIDEAGMIYLLGANEDEINAE